MIVNKIKQKFAHIAMIVAILSGFALPVVAQTNGDEPEPTPVVADAIDITELDFVDENPDDPLSVALNTLASNVYAVVYSASAAGFVIVLTSFTKRVPGLNAFKSAHIALAYMSIAWLFYVFANYGGYTEQLEEFFATFEQVGFILLGVTGTPVLYTNLYKANKEAKTPLVGYTKHESIPAAARRE